MAAITSSSTAEYFAKNLQQVGFSSATKAVLTTLKESIDNSLDACESNGIPPELTVEVNRLGTGSQNNTELIHIVVEDNGPGIDPDDLGKVFGEYLASSKFGKGQCSRGQQGIGISAAVTWAQLTQAQGVKVISKTKGMRKAVSALVEVDIKGNKGIVKKKETIDWDPPHGVRLEFKMDGRLQLNGEAGIITYLEGTTIVNPHLTLHYKLADQEWVHVERVSSEVPEIPAATKPHPHTMKLGEFMTFAGLFPKTTFGKFLKEGFSRISDQTLKDIVAAGLSKKILDMPITKMGDEHMKEAFKIIHKTELMAPSTKSVLSVGEDSLAKSIGRLGQVDFLSVVTRKPRICDFKPVVVEVAIARFLNRGDDDQPVQVLRFANRVPLQFDKSACAITNAIETVNWKSYGLNQPKESVPLGSFVFAVSVVSPFIKFKNASKETIDASDELVEEIRRTLMQAGQKLSRHIRHEDREADLERKLQHIEQFGPILVEGLVAITGSSEARKKKAEEGLKKLLGRDANAAEAELSEAHESLKKLKKKETYLTEDDEGGGDAAPAAEEEVAAAAEPAEEEASPAKGKKGEKAGKVEKVAKAEKAPKGEKKKKGKKGKKNPEAEA